jgi:hypothetical protein
MGGIGAALGGVLGAFGGYQDAKQARKEAAKGINTTEKTERTPYGPATSHIQDIVNEARRLYDQGGANPGGPMPYAWQNFFNNPTSPGAGADPTYGGASGGASGANLNWRGRDRSEVQAAKATRQAARTEARKAPTASPGGQGGGMPPQGQPGAPAPPGPQFQAQQGPFGYSQGIRDYMMQQFQGPGVGGYQPAMQYIQGLLGGQSQNPFLSTTFNQLQAPRQDYFSAWRK